MNTLKLVSVSQFLLYKWNYKSKVVNERFWYEIVSEAVWSGLLLHALLALWSRQRRQSLSPSMHLNHPAWWRQSTMEPHWNFKTARSTTINKGHGTFRGVSGDASWAITLGSTTNWPASVVSLQLCSTLNPTLPAGRQQRGFYSKRLNNRVLAYITTPFLHRELGISSRLQMLHRKPLQFWYKVQHCDSKEKPTKMLQTWQSPYEAATLTARN